MPWVDKEKCVGCNVCVEKCPAGAIVMEDRRASINMEKCIRCGTCHDLCQWEAVRHDGEKTPDDVKSNLERTKRYMDLCAEYLGDDKEREKCLQRMIRSFNRDKLVAEKTLEKLEKLIGEGN